MTRRRGGALLGVGIALGLAIGAVGSTLGASPAPSTGPQAPWGWMMGSGGMMGGWSPAPGATYGPGMMDGVNGAARDALLKACDEMHDAMHRAWSGSDASPAP